MAYNWINAKDYTMDCFLLFDRWALKWIFTDCSAFEWFFHESVEGGIIYNYRKQVKKSAE